MWDEPWESPAAPEEPWDDPYDAERDFYEYCHEEEEEG